jgi:CheY-like chemotaxis protein
MFARGRSPATQPQPGIGIGLALARGLVQMHGGRIEARSEGLGRGSEFIVHLPVLAQEAAQVSPALDKETNLEGRAARRVLVVDDERVVAQALAALLRLLGNEVETAHDGLAAIAAAERHRPDLILLDIGMPKLDGYVTCQRIREQPWGEAIEIVALTGWGTEEDRRLSAEAGFDGHLVKPVEVSTLAKLLGERRARTG